MANFTPRAYRGSNYTVRSRLGRLSFKEAIGKKFLGLNPARVRELGLQGAHEERREHVINTLLGKRSKFHLHKQRETEQGGDTGEDENEEETDSGFLPQGGRSRRGREQFASNIRSSVLGSTEKSVAGNEQIAKNLSVVASIIEKKGDEQADLFERLFTLLEQVPVTQRQAQTQQDRLMHQIAKLVVAIEKEAEHEEDPERQEKLNASADTLRNQGEFIGRQRGIPTHWPTEPESYQKHERVADAQSRMAELMERERNDINESRAEPKVAGSHRGMGVIDRDAVQSRSSKSKPSRMRHAPHGQGTMKYFLDKILQESIAQRKILERQASIRNSAPQHIPTPAQPTAKATTAPPSNAGHFQKGNQEHRKVSRGPDGKFQKKDPVIAPAESSGIQAEKIENTPSVEDQAAAKTAPTAPSSSWLSGLFGFGKKAVGGLAGGIAGLEGLGGAATLGAAGLMVGAGVVGGNMIENGIKNIADDRIADGENKTLDWSTSYAQQMNLRNQLMKRGMNKDQVNNEMSRRFGKGLIASPLSAPQIPPPSFTGPSAAVVGLPPSNLTERIDTSPQAVAEPSQTIINHNDNSVTNQSAGGGNAASPNVRTTDNSFIRFQDKRQVRIL